MRKREKVRERDGKGGSGRNSNGGPNMKIRPQNHNTSLPYQKNKKYI